MSAAENSGSSVRGSGVMVLSAVLFAVVFLISGVVHAPSEVAFGWRIVITAACYATTLTHPLPRRLLRQFWTAVTVTWWMPPCFLMLCTVMGIQLWLFSWAPQNGHALDASLGFLLMPISLVLGGRLMLGSRVTRAQWAATALGLAAVAIKIALTPHMSWVTFFVCIGYPIYFVVRRRTGLDNPMAFGAEVAAVAPVALYFVISAAGRPTDPLTLLQLMALGLAGAGAMASYLAAAALLPIPLFGLLGYLELVLLVIVSLLLGERMDHGDLWTYGLLER